MLSQVKLCLNPCFNGRYSLSGTENQTQTTKVCLNPCFNGRYSLSIINEYNKVRCTVLILVLMEDTL